MKIIAAALVLLSGAITCGVSVSVSVRRAQRQEPNCLWCVRPERARINEEELPLECLHRPRQT
jgi:hypothetical protein